ncbi:MAG: hypothetical protein ACYC0X_26990 [Pirellulaceae bacterium]
MTNDGFKKRDHAVCAWYMRIVLTLLVQLFAGGGVGDDLIRVSAAESRQTVIVVLGAAGAEEYDVQFTAWHDRWKEVCERTNAAFRCVGRDHANQESDLQQLQSALVEETIAPGEPLWLVLIGHGTFDGRQAKFNLRGDDLTAEQLAEWLAPLQRPLVIVNCASASGPFLKALAEEQRIVIVSTKSGYQYNFARFGDYLSQTIGDPQADLDKDGQTSLLEAYLSAASRTAEFYRQEARLATEEALLDDTGDGLGTPAQWFRGIRAVTKPQDGVTVDGIRAHQVHLVRNMQEQQLTPEARARRDALEQQIAALRERKDSLDADAYYGQLQPVMLELARWYAELDNQ